jgi:hypothetical protein
VRDRGRGGEERWRRILTRSEMALSSTADHRQLNWITEAARGMGFEWRSKERKRGGGGEAHWSLVHRRRGGSPAAGKSGAMAARWRWSGGRWVGEGEALFFFFNGKLY